MYVYTHARYIKRANTQIFITFFAKMIEKDTIRRDEYTKKEELLSSSVWAFTDSNRRPSACRADALNQLS